MITSDRRCCWLLSVHRGPLSHCEFVPITQSTLDDGIHNSLFVIVNWMQVPLNRILYSHLEHDEFHFAVAAKIDLIIASSDSKCITGNSMKISKCFAVCSQEKTTFFSHLHSINKEIAKVLLLLEVCCTSNGFNLKFFLLFYFDSFLFNEKLIKRFFSRFKR